MSATVSAGTRAEAPAGRLPGTWSIGLSRGALEIRQFFRLREQVVFTFAFPVVFLFLFASIFSDDLRDAGITASQLYVPAMMAAGIMSTSFQSLGISIAIERDEKVLRRLRGTPMPPAAYFLGKIWLVLVTGLLETASVEEERSGPPGRVDCHLKIVYHIVLRQHAFEHLAEGRIVPASPSELEEGSTLDPRCGRLKQAVERLI